MTFLKKKAPSSFKSTTFVLMLIFIASIFVSVFMSKRTYDSIHSISFKNTNGNVNASSSNTTKKGESIPSGMVTLSGNSNIRIPDREGDPTKKDAPLNPMLQTEDAGTLIKATNSSDYRWVGNQWVAPQGVPMFTPTQIKAYFQTRSILIIGDSLSRRLYNTLYALCTADDLTDITVKELDATEVINENTKGKKFKDQCTAESNRALFNKNVGGMKRGVCRELNTTNTSITDEDLLVDENATNITSSRKTVRFDHTTKYNYHEIGWLWRDAIPTDPNKNTQAIGHDYDLVILALGAWEFKVVDANSTMTSRMKDMLDSIQKNNPKNTQVVFRTSGFDRRKGTENQMVWDTIAASNEYFHDLYESNDHANMTLVDWGGVVGKRTFGENWIAGDHPAHYGLQARLLLIQQLMHELVKADLLRADRE